MWSIIFAVAQGSTTIDPVRKGVFQPKNKLEGIYSSIPGLTQLDCETILYADAKAKGVYIDADDVCHFADNDTLIPTSSDDDRVTLYQPIPDKMKVDYSWLLYTQYENPVGPLKDYGTTEADCIAALATYFHSKGSRFYDYSPPPCDEFPDGISSCRGFSSMHRAMSHSPSVGVRTGILPEPRSMLDGVDFIIDDPVTTLTSGNPGLCANACILSNAYLYRYDVDSKTCTCAHSASSHKQTPGVVSGSAGPTILDVPTEEVVTTEPIGNGILTVDPSEPLTPIGSHSGSGSGCGCCCCGC